MKPPPTCTLLVYYSTNTHFLVVLSTTRTLMATPRFLVFFSLLLLAFNFQTHVLAAREMVMEKDGKIMGRRLIARQLDISWRGNYSPPPPIHPPLPPPPPPPYCPRSRSRSRSRPCPPR
ncbi:uncharacterized protein LOC120092883 [Benincasa hispida]|uniref:uncharacterized protein LOC120092883 n=1 Tax=Benincasa hispida TaxID=102211 RepID=UPI001901E84F|nr:uncharacterized protein LOC120092883 [Benincasa hispida]